MEIISKEDDTEFSLSELYDPRSKWTVEQKMNAAMGYVCTGTCQGASDITTIPAGTIRRWSSEAKWWPEAVQECKKNKQEELDGNLTAVIHKVMDEIADRVTNGDVVMTKDGGQVRKKIGARDLAIIAGTMFDKRALLRGDPTSRSETTSQGAALKELKEMFTDMSNQVNAKIINPEKEE